MLRWGNYWHTLVCIHIMIYKIKHIFYNPFLLYHHCIVSRYLTKLHAICVIWDASSTSDFNNTWSEMLKLSNVYASEAPSPSSSPPPNFYLIMTMSFSSAANTSVWSDDDDDDQLLAARLSTAIDSGCQVYIYI